MANTKLLKNCNIISVANNDRFNSILVKEDKIEKVGNLDDLRNYIDADTEVIDLKGYTVLPGFVDTHAHLLGFGRSFHMVDLSQVRSIKDLISVCKDFLEENNYEVPWLFGRGWDQNLFEEDNSRFPTRLDLDQISQEIPILLIRTCGHIGLSNTEALKRTGITNETFIEGGSFDRDDSGAVNGIIREASLEWYKKRIKPLPSKDELKKFILSGSKEMIKYGVTSIHTEDTYDLGYSGDFFDIYDAYKELVKEKALPIRVYQKVSLPKEENIKDFINRGHVTGEGDVFYKIGPVKQWCDGTMGARTAAMLDEYSDDKGNFGIYVYSKEELFKNVKLCHENNLQMCLHAIGDGALNQVLEVYEEVIDMSDIKDHRHRIVHCQVGNKELYKKLKRVGANINIQPMSTATDIPIMNSRLGDHREKEAHNWRTIEDLGVVISASSDIPVESPNVFYGIHAIVNRKNLDGLPKDGWLKEEAVTVKEAIKMYTLNGAYSAFEEDIKGSIEEGKLADLVVIDKNPISEELDKIKDIKVLATMIGGDFKYISN